ncbi:MAG: beta-ketoacyl synthase [Opitutia bacterium Tous-C1TDCM]|nr:MAG: beta-ketoacyl synthase [Opitutae bacterium Tous-C1TDCM]
MPGRVVITGLGFITPIGNERAEVVASIRDLRHGLETVPWLPEAGVSVAGTVKDFDLAAFEPDAWRWPERYSIAPETLRSLPPHGVYAYCAIEQALEESRLTRAELGDGTTGLFCASAGSPRFLHHHLGEMLQSEGRRIDPWGVVRSIPGTLNFNLAAHYGIRGAVTGFASACAHALGYARDEIALGRHKRMIVVGAEEPTVESILPFAGLRALSRQTDPVLASRPFDAASDGFVGAGGAAVLILEDADVARNRGAVALAEFVGWGQSANGHSVAQSEPTGAGLETAMRRALAAAGVDPIDVDYVNAHATGTPVDDRAEAAALRRVFGDIGPAVSSTKALTGHPLSMSGALEAGICTLALDVGFIPGQAHLQTVDPECEHLRLPSSTLDVPVRTVLGNSSGFGGSNVALVLRAVR